MFIYYVRFEIANLHAFEHEGLPSMQCPERFPASFEMEYDIIEPSAWIGVELG